MDERTDKRKVATSNRYNILNNDMLMVICDKFHHEGTLASLKTNMTKHFNLSGMEGWFYEQTHRQTDEQMLITPIYMNF